MMFNTKPTCVILITRNSLVAYSRDGKSAKSALPATAVNNLEISNRSAYSEAVSTFLSSVNIRNQQILLLTSESITFERSFSSRSGPNLQEFLDDYCSKLPLDPARQTVVAYQRQGTTDCWAINSDLYKLLASRLEMAGNKILGCVPATFFGIQADQPLDSQHCTLVFDKIKIRKCPNFMAK